MGQFSPEQSIDFARKLQGEGDYYRAILEYKRAYYNLPDTGAYKFLKDEVAYSIVKLYEKLGDFEEAAMYMSRITDKQSRRYYFEAGLLSLLQNDYERAREYWHYSDTLCAWVDLRQGNLYRAEKVLGPLTVPHKSPLTASFLSAFVPGLGKVYVQRTYDGLFSFVLNSGMLYLAYDAYKHSRKPEFYTYSGLFMFFYSGNIYGSWVAARQFNQTHLKLAIAQKEMEIGVWKYLP